MPKMPDFALVRDVPAPPGALYVAVQSDGDSWSPLAVLVMVDGIKRPMVLYADEDGRVVLPENRRAISVKMLLPVYETGGDPVTLSGNSGHRLLFRLEPNDIGKAPLHGERLAIEGASLVLYRYDRKILFRRVGSSDSKRRRH